MRRLLAFLGLPWDEACLNFHASARPVKTASVAQVRTPLLMCEAYDSILAKLERRGFRPPRERTRLNKFTMFGLLLRYGIV